MLFYPIFREFHLKSNPKILGKSPENFGKITRKFWENHPKTLEPEGIWRFKPCKPLKPLPFSDIALCAEQSKNKNKGYILTKTYPNKLLIT